MELVKGEKRQKVVDYDKFRAGFILRVKVTNFTTYGSGVFNLSPRLNMIIGPNGTGKSTLVAAICLGLAGRIELIKRKTLKSMIKTGRTEAKIEITLKNFQSMPDIIIERTFTEKDSKWKVNNRRSDEKSVKKICKDFNIQLDNLCQFLPQERVAEFAGLSPEKLLVETERTIGNGQLLNMHETLITNDNELVELLIKIDKTEKDYNHLIQQRDRLQDEADKYQEYQTKTLELDNHNLLIPYAQIQDLKVQQIHLKRARDKAKKEYEDFSLSSQPIERNLETFTNELREITKQIDLKRHAYDELETTRKKIQLDIDSGNTKRDEFVVSLLTLKTRSERKRQELEGIVKDVAKLKSKLQEVPSIDESETKKYQKKRDQKHTELLDLRSKIESIELAMRPKKTQFSQLNEQLKEKRERISSTDKLTLLDSRAQDLGRRVNQWMENSYGAHKYLRSKPEWKGLYYEAPIISCEVIDKRYAKHIERVIDNNTLICISFNNETYYNELSGKVFEKYNAPMRLITKNATHLKYSRDKLQEFGFDGYLSDFLSGQLEVLNMLNDVAKLNNIPVALNPLKEEQLDRLLKGNDIIFPKFLAGDSFFNVFRSRYGSKQSFFTTEKIQPSRFFTLTGLTEYSRNILKEEISTLSNQLQKIIADVDVNKNEIEELNGHLREINEEFKDLNLKIEEHTKLRNIHTTLRSRIAAKEQQIVKLEQESNRDYTDKIIQVEQRIKENEQKLSEIYVRLSKIVEEQVKIMIELSLEKFTQLQIENKVVVARKFLENLGTHKEELKQTYLAAKAKYDEIKKSDAAKKIQQQSAAYAPEQRQVLGALAAQYLESNTLTEINIREKIKILEDERSLLSSVDQNSITSLRQKLQEIEFAERELPILKKKKQQLDSRIDSIRQQWEPELINLIEQVSKTFQKRFVAVASDGRVEIARAERFKDWRLQILVKFRENTELKVLDHQSQSGGERAVSTIFFIMSLQGLTDAPFRVVDEINQGMDPKNEKSAHKYLVHIACQQSSTSQYFLVTPKLLTGLYYHPDMMIHCIFTGSTFKDEDRRNSEFLDFSRVKSLE